MKKNLVIISLTIIVAFLGSTIWYFRYKQKQRAVENIGKYSRELNAKTDEEILSEFAGKVFGKEIDELHESEKIKLFFELSEDAKVSNRIIAARELSSYGDYSEVVEKLISKLEDGNRWVVEEAISSLEKIGDQRAVEPLISFIQSANVDTEELYTPFSETEAVALYGTRTSNGSSTDIVLKLKEFLPKNKDNRSHASLPGSEKVNLLIPGDFDLYVSFYDFDMYVSELENSELTKLITGLKVWEVFKQLPYLKSYFVLQEQLRFLRKQLSLKSWLGRNTKLAFFKSGDRLNYLLIGNVKTDVEMIDHILAVAKNSQSTDEKWRIGHQNYRGHRLTCLNERGGSKSIVYVTLADNTIVSNESKLIKRTLDIYAGGGVGSIAINSTFVNALSLTTKDNFMFAYFNPQKLLEFTLDGKSASYVVNAAARAVERIAGKKAEVREVYKSAKRKVDPLGDNPGLGEINKLLRLIPKDAAFSFTSSYVNLNRYGNYLGTLRASKKAIKDIEINTELSIHDDIISKLGSKAVYFYPSIKNEESYVFLRSALGVELRDSENVERTMKRVFDYLFSVGGSTKQREYNDVNIYFIDNPGTFSPSFAIIDNYLVVCFDAATMEALIDVDERDSVLDNHIFETLRKRVMGKGESVMFLNGEFFFTALESDMTTLAKVCRKFDVEEIDLKIKPLLDALDKSVNGIGKLDLVDDELRGEFRFVFDKE